MIRVGIIGATGYTGMELLRLLSSHQGVLINYVTSRTWAGETVAKAVPHLTGMAEHVLEKFNPSTARAEAEFFFVCLPHGESMETVGILVDDGSKVVDMSADFRLSDPALYEQWYGEHTRKGLLPLAVYGMAELHRRTIAEARLVANPGCYPASIIPALVPLIEGGLIDPGSIVADSKSGVTGAGREPRPNLHFPEVHGNFSAYSIAGVHRHTGEIEQELGRLAGGEIRVTFSPHLLPVGRGILSTIYASPAGKIDEEELYGVFAERYAGEPFIRICDPGSELPSLKDVRGTNMCLISPRLDMRTGRIIVVSCIDNLVKGAAGQALQNMNLMTGQPETKGLEHVALHP